MKRLRLPALLLVLPVVACGGGGSGELGPAELGRLGAQIYEQPGDAAEVLADAGLTQEEFEAEVRVVSTDPEKARTYAEAFRAELGGVEPGTAVSGTAPTPLPTAGP